MQTKKIRFKIKTMGEAINNKAQHHLASSYSLNLYKNGEEQINSKSKHNQCKSISWTN